VPSILYSYSFALNPDWSRHFCGQEEIHAYLLSIAQEWGLFKHIRFSTAVEEARWNAQDQKWEVDVRVTGAKDAEFTHRYTISTDFLVSAVGQLNVPSYPDIPGLDTFRGKTMHSARWDWNYPIEGKRVAIIGNGATAIQIIPEAAKWCSSVTVFQRSPNWILPRLDAEIPVWRRKLYRYVPLVMRRLRSNLMALRDSYFYNAIVRQGTSGNDALRRECLEFLEKEIPDNAALRAKLTPTYPPGCKRILVSDDLYAAYNEPNLTLETRRIDRVTATGVVVKKGGGGSSSSSREEKEEDEEEYGVDLIVLATGFRAAEFLSPIRVVGRHGRTLDEIWAASGGPRAFLGMTVEDLPNFAMLYGPNTNLGHNSIILMLEAESRYIGGLVSKVTAARADGESLVITPSRTAVDRFNDEIQRVLATSTFGHPDCTSWYKNEAGLITNNWSGTALDYQRRTARIDWAADFDLEGTAADRVKALQTTYLGRAVAEDTGMGGWAIVMTSVVVAAAAVVGAMALRNPH
jgi:cation diffusion facilitator CzcD-associated flavoprotein CzcO